MDDLATTIPSSFHEHLLDWKRRAIIDELTDDEEVYKGYIVENVKVVDLANRQVEWTISTGMVDRDQDTIAVAGWQLENFRKNPVVLWAHSSRQPPVGRAPEVEIKGKRLRSVSEFTPAGVSPFNDMIFNMVVLDFLRAVSVGFLPMEFERAPEDSGRGFGFDFLKQDLLEYSVVPVPANPEALRRAKDQGVDLNPMIAWAEQTLDDWSTEGKGLLLPRKVVERAYRIADGEKTIVALAIEPSDLAAAALKDLGIEAVDVDVVEHVEPAKETDDEDKGVIGYATAHPDGTPLAGKDSTLRWDVRVERRAADASDLKVISAWVEDGGEDRKSAYRFLHHRAATPHSCVFRALVAAAGRLAASTIPEADKTGVRQHVGRHYREFDETAPWDRDAAAWTKFSEVAAQLLGDLDPDEVLPPTRVAALATEFATVGFELEAGVLRSEPTAPTDADLDKATEEFGLADIETALASLGDEPADDLLPKSEDAELFDAFLDEENEGEAKDLIAEALASSVDDATAALRGRLD